MQAETGRVCLRLAELNATSSTRASLMQEDPHAILAQSFRVRIG